jgi:hypothetical protein
MISKTSRIQRRRCLATRAVGQVLPLPARGVATLSVPAGAGGASVEEAMPSEAPTVASLPR